MSPESTQQDSVPLTPVGRARKLFSTQSGLAEIAALMAGSHPRAIDYIEQAPVIVLTATRGKWPRCHQERVYLCSQIGEAARRGDRLKDVMRAFGAPFPLRRLGAYSLLPSVAETVVALGDLPPSVVSQAIPPRPAQQRTWLAGLRNWRSGVGRRTGRSGFLFEWVTVAWSHAVQTLPKAQTSPVQLFDMTDFVVAGIDGRARPFNPLWTYGAARRAEDEWHAELARRRHNENFVTRFGIGFEDPIDYGRLPAEAEYGSYKFIALRSGLDLFLEGEAMRHCVASYMNSVLTGASRIYSIQDRHGRVATLELRPHGKRFQVAQLKGPCNTKPARRVNLAVAAFMTSLIEPVRDAPIVKLDGSSVTLGDTTFDIGPLTPGGE